MSTLLKQLPLISYLYTITNSQGETHHCVVQPTRFNKNTYWNGKAPTCSILVSQWVLSPKVMRVGGYYHYALIHRNNFS